MTWIAIFIKILLSGLVILPLGLIFSILLVAARKWLTVRADREHTVYLANGGNCRSIYSLTVSSLESSLAFTLLNNQVPLVEIKDLVENQPVVLASSDALASTLPTTVTKHPTNPLQTASKKAGSVASILGSLGGLLPGKLGHKFGQQASNMRDLQVQSSKVVYAPSKLGRKVEPFQRSGGVKADTQHSTGNQTNEVEGGVDASRNRHFQNYYGAQTGELLPGDMLTLTLRIGTRNKRYPVGSFIYTIQSEQIVLNLTDVKPPLVTKSGTVLFEAREEWRYWLLPLANVSLILLALVSLTYSLLLLWQ